ncbi:unnamed protein product [Polarella glacialis]|uniref:Uncharacterized protein n=1 Tax=Polarella glacialis TaxID=89957 RepID=A0A813GYU9_POLGL|nr:unnamed protein product [Polarella glacialis]CAE8667801.1 unnamed protein product [Polarella glacialis]CAE8743945.1 unnamed protein product [Polarella glacialis]
MAAAPAARAAEVPTPAPPVRATPSAPPARPKQAPPVVNAAPATRVPSTHSRHAPSGRPGLLRSRFVPRSRNQQQRPPNDELEETIQQLFLLGQVLQQANRPTHDAPSADDRAEVVEFDLTED